jgi:hypothetical protein
VGGMQVIAYVSKPVSLPGIFDAPFRICFLNKITEISVSDLIFPKSMDI